MEEPSTDAEKQLADVGSGNDNIEILISYALWIQWGDIAIEREDRARTARADMIALARYRQEYTPALGEELMASMVSISAAAHALDALYGQLVTPGIKAEIKAEGPWRKASRDGHIRECLKRRFNTGGRDRAWVGEFKWLFDLRNAAAHAEEQQLPSVPHPSGVCNSGQVNRDYSADAAMRAVDLMLDVLNTCAAKPKASDVGARQWARSYSPAISTLTTKLRVSRTARPLPARYEDTEA